MRFSYKGIAWLAALCGALGGCNEPFEPTIRLAVDQNLVALPATEGMTRVMVYSTGNWSLSVDSESGDAWARIDRKSGRENGDFLFEYDANGGLSREATIRIQSGDRACEVVMSQAAGIADPTLTVTPGSVALLGEGCPVTMTLSSNLGPDLARVQHEIAYGEESGEGWIGDVTLDSAAAIDAAKSAYDALSDEDKELVGADRAETLENAVAKLNQLRHESQMAQLDTIYKTTGDYISGLGTPGVGSIGGEWMTIGLARSGRDVPSDYYDAVVDYVKANIDENGRLDRHRQGCHRRRRVQPARRARQHGVHRESGHQRPHLGAHRA